MTSPGRTVYVIDDDVSLLRALQRLLRAQGFTVETFASAEAFLESKTSDGQTACLLLDIHLGGMTGFELQEHLTALGLSIPIVFMTAHDDLVTRERARMAGAVAYLRKPFDDQAVIAALRYATHSTRGCEKAGAEAGNVADKIRDRLDRGILPREDPEKLYAGYGEGLPCDGCDQLILPAQVEWEFRMLGGGRTRLHVGCAGLWEAERRRRGWSPPAKETDFGAR